MTLILVIIGIAILVISVVAGIMTGAFIGFLTAIAGGLASAVIFLALAKVLENQEAILYKLQYFEEIYKSARRQETKVCPKCSRQYEGDMNSCPHCGHRM